MMKRRLKRVLISLSLPLFLLPCALHASTTVERIRKAKELVCGIDQSEAEFSTADDHGPRVEFDQDLCRAVAAAVLGREAKVVNKGFPDDQTSVAALQAGEIDLIASLSADFLHTTNRSISLTTPVLYDPVMVMVPASSRLSKISELNGKKICFIEQTEVEVMLTAWLEAHHVDFVPFPFREEGEMEAAYITGNCTGLAGDSTRLAASRTAFGSRAKEHILLPDLISKDTLALTYRASDAQLGQILEWTFNILLQAEESGVTASNVRSLQASHDPVIERLLGRTREVGAPLGLDDDWALRVIEAVGNYGEIFARDLGADSPMKLPRGQNALWENGGLMYALPLK